MNACGVRNHVVANAFDVAVFGRLNKYMGRCEIIIFAKIASDARDGSILHKHER